MNCLVSQGPEPPSNSRMLPSPEGIKGKHPPTPQPPQQKKPLDAKKAEWEKGGRGVYGPESSSLAMRWTVKALYALMRVARASCSAIAARLTSASHSCRTGSPTQAVRDPSSLPLVRPGGCRGARPCTTGAAGHCRR